MPTENWGMQHFPAIVSQYKKATMKLLLVICVLAIIGCSKKELGVPAPGLYGKWQKFAESYPAPTDGFGGWNPVENGYTIEFDSSGMITDSRGTYLSFQLANKDSILMKVKPGSTLTDKWYRYSFETTGELLLNDPVPGYYPVIDKLKVIR
jgi:hypothetical protein